MVGMRKDNDNQSETQAYTVALSPVVAHQQEGFQDKQKISFDRNGGNRVLPNLTD